MLERITPHEVPPPPAEDRDEAPAEAARGRGVAREPSRKGTTSKTAKGGQAVKGRTIYLPETLFERIMVQAHRKGRTISEYVTAILERQVPDYRTVRAESSDTDAA